jgi:hypothetical protein
LARTTNRDVLDRRALNRATLARQLLLERTTTTPLDAVSHLVGLQAQVPLNPYLALWSRLDGFDPDELAQLVVDRAVVRIVVMRGTLHLVTADDCLPLRALAQPVLDRELRMHRDHAPSLLDVDLAPVLAFAGPLLGAQALTPTELRAALAERFPELDAAALAYACRNHLALVQVPPRGVWGRGGAVRTMTAESYLGRAPVTDPSIDDVVLRYFAAFGPATVADVASWSRLTGLREVVDRVAPHLRPFTDDDGRELFDLPDAPRPGGDVEAPPRFLPEYDNALLSHADRTRFGDDERRRALWADNRVVRGTVLVDGHVSGTWAFEREGRDRVALVVHHLDGLPRADLAAVDAEAHAMVQFHHPDAAAHDVRLVPVPR